MQRGPRHDVNARAVVTNEIHVYAGEIADPRPQVTGQVQRLDEHLGQDHGGSNVEVHTSVEPGDDRGQKVKIPQAGRPDRRPVRTGMHVNDIGSDPDVNGGRKVEPRGRREDRQPPARQAVAQYGIADGTAQPGLAGCAIADGAVEKQTRLAGHAEAAVLEAGRHILGRGALIGELEVVNDPGAVHGDRGHDAAFHEIDQDGAQPDLDDMGAEADDDLAPVAMAAGHQTRRGAKIGGRQDVRQAVDEGLE